MERSVARQAIVTLPSGTPTEYDLLLLTTERVKMLYDVLLFIVDFEGVVVLQGDLSRDILGDLH